MVTLISLVPLLLACTDPPATTSAPSSAVDVVSALETALADAIAKAEPSVVAISRDKSEDGATRAIRGRGAPPQTDDLNRDQLSFDYGSGVVIGDHGEILTAFHVVKGASRLVVRAIGRQAFRAEIIAADPRSDLAVIVPREAPGALPPKLKPLPLGDATKLRKGSFLIALGNPFNAASHDGRPSASWGILSNVARRIEATEDNQLVLKNFPTLLQLDSKLNLGMSGGAVVNLRGELVGLTNNSANAAGFDAQAGYAIPLDAMGRRAVESLREGKEVEYGWLGIRLDLENGTSRVNAAQPGSPAALGEVLVEDVIVGVGDMPVTDMESLVLAINTMRAGAKVKLRIIRRNEPIERTVELAKLRVDGEVIATNRPAPWRGLRVDYTSTLVSSNFSHELQRALSAGAVAVAEVEGNSPAEKAGLRPGQVIRSVEGRSIHNPREFIEAVADLTGAVVIGTESGSVTVR